MERPSFKDTLKIVGATIATGAVLYETSNLALTRGARKEAGARDNWTCQGVDGEDCYMETVTGEEISFQNGYYVTLAHYKTTADQSGRGYHDPHAENARCLCQVCHATEETDMKSGGDTLLLNNGLYTINDVKEGKRAQRYLDVEQALEIRYEARMIKKTERVDKERLESVRMALGSGGKRRL